FLHFANRGFELIGGFGLDGARAHFAAGDASGDARSRAGAGHRRHRRAARTELGLRVVGSFLPIVRAAGFDRPLADLAAFDPAQRRLELTSLQQDIAGVLTTAPTEEDADDH